MSEKLCNSILVGVTKEELNNLVSQSYSDINDVTDYLFITDFYDKINAKLREAAALGALKYISEKYSVKEYKQCIDKIESYYTLAGINVKILYDDEENCHFVFSWDSLDLIMNALKMTIKNSLLKNSDMRFSIMLHNPNISDVLSEINKIIETVENVTFITISIDLEVNNDYLLLVKWERKEDK